MKSSNHAPGTTFDDCPACGGEIYDNREKIDSGQFKATAPEFACKDKTDCKWVSWPEREKKGERGAARPSRPHSLDAEAPKHAPTVSGRLTPTYSYGDLLTLAASCWEDACNVVGSKRDPSQFFASLFKHCSGKHLMPPESLEDMPKALKGKPEKLPYDDDPGMEE